MTDGVEELRRNYNTKTTFIINFSCNSCAHCSNNNKIQYLLEICRNIWESGLLWCMLCLCRPWSSHAFLDFVDNMTGSKCQWTISSNWSKTLTDLSPFHWRLIDQIFVFEAALHYRSNNSQESQVTRVWWRTLTLTGGLPTANSSSIRMRRDLDRRCEQWLIKSSCGVICI